MLRTVIPLAAVVLLSAGVGRADDKADIRKEVEKQIELIKKGDANKLKEHFTDRLRPRITDDAVRDAKKRAEQVTVDELVHKVAAGKDKDGNKTIQVKMKNGRSLTTFVQSDGKWLADTIWFK